ncbi:MAG: OBG GTPase family GTP-binding protein [Candidatus Anstonellales archaeon]
MNIQEKIKAIEEEIARTQKNKATEHHLGLLKAKIAKLRRALLAPKKSGGAGYDVKKTGDATVSIIGFPSVGKSTLLNALTGAKSKTAAYEFTTLSTIPGGLIYKGAEIQVLDLPGIIQGAKDGKGRGREVIGVARKSDLLLILIDPFALWQHKIILEELHACGIRINEQPPSIVIEKKATGGITAVWTCREKGITINEVQGVLQEYGMHNANIIFHEPGSIDRLIDVLEKNRAYIPAVTVLTKVDLLSDRGREEIKKQIGEYIPVSALNGEGMEKLKEKIFNTIGFIRIHTKDDFGKVADKPMVLKKGARVEDICRRIHTSWVENFRYALVWGKSVKFPGQRVGLGHVLEEGDVVRIVAK